MNEKKILHTWHTLFEHKLHYVIADRVRGFDFSVSMWHVNSIDSRIDTKEKEQNIKNEKEAQKI